MSGTIRIGRARPQSDVPDFRLGEEVSDAKFGEGTVIGVEPGGIVVDPLQPRRLGAQAAQPVRASDQALTLRADADGEEAVGWRR